MLNTIIDTIQNNEQFQLISSSFLKLFKRSKPFRIFTYFSAGFISLYTIDIIYNKTYRKITGIPSGPSPPYIHVYGSDHSPWAQALITFLEYKQLKYTINATPDLKSMLHNKRNHNVSLYQMPVLHYNDQILSETTDIMKFINSKHPYPALNESIEYNELDKKNITRVFMHALTRTKSRLFQFYYKWSLQKDYPSSLISLFFRPTIVLYFSTLLALGTGFGSNQIVQQIAKSLEQDVQVEDNDAYYPRNTFIFGLRYFEQESERLYNEDKECPSVLDFILFGQFQCLYSGLSDECIPVVGEYFPTSKQWFDSMHKLILSKNAKYKRMYSNDQMAVSNYLERVVYWVGFTLGFPVNMACTVTAIITRGRL